MSSLPDITVALGWKPGPVDETLDENVLSGVDCHTMSDNYALGL